MASICERRICKSYLNGIEISVLLERVCYAVLLTSANHHSSYHTFWFCLTPVLWQPLLFICLYPISIALARRIPLIIFIDIGDSQLSPCREMLNQSQLELLQQCSNAASSSTFHFFLMNRCDLTPGCIYNWKQYLESVAPYFHHLGVNLHDAKSICPIVSLYYHGPVHVRIHWNWHFFVGSSILAAMILLYMDIDSAI